MLSIFLAEHCLRNPDMEQYHSGINGHLFLHTGDGSADGTSGTAGPRRPRHRPASQCGAIGESGRSHR